MARAGWAALLLIASTASAEQPTLDTVLERVGRWVAAYEQTLGNVVAEEVYEQSVSGDRRYRYHSGRLLERPTGRRTRAEFLLVRIGDRWHGFRDVVEVDGGKVIARPERLLGLFAEETPTTARLRQLREESSRYNIGRIARDVNVPTFPLELLRAEHRPRFSFERIAIEQIDGTRALRLEFTETGRPTLVATRNGDDVPLRGRVWVDPVLGRLHRAEIDVRGTNRVRTRLVVDYGAGDGGLWVPTEMREHYETTDRSEMVRTMATYAHYRRFGVAVDASVAPAEDERGRRRSW